MLTIEQIQNTFDVTISPIIDNVDENSDTRSVSSMPKVPFNVDTRSTTSSVFEDKPRPTTSSVFEDKPRPTTIKLGLEWALIAAHPRFKLEYKEFIHNELGGAVDVTGDEATYHGNFPPNMHGSTNEVILGNKTNEFMQKFKYQKLVNLGQHHVDILREKSATVAYSRLDGSDYMVATRFQDMLELKRQLFPKKNQRSQPEQPTPLMKLPLNQKSTS